MVYNITY